MENLLGTLITPVQQQCTRNGKLHIKLLSEPPQINDTGQLHKQMLENMNNRNDQIKVAQTKYAILASNKTANRV
jgi:hypothetical protein